MKRLFELIALLALASPVFGATAQFGARGVNSIVPLDGITQRTKEVTLTVTPSAGSISSTNLAKAVAYADSSGNWRMVGNVNITMSAAIASGTTFALTGVVFDSDGDQSCVPHYSTDNYRVITKAGTANLEYGCTTCSNSNFITSFDVALNAKPTWADANIEAGPALSAYIPEATASVPGIVNTGAQTFGGRKTIKSASGNTSSVIVDTTDAQNAGVDFSNSGSIKWSMYNAGFDDNFTLYDIANSKYALTIVPNTLDTRLYGNVGFGANPRSKIQLRNHNHSDVFYTETAAAGTQTLFSFQCNTGGGSFCSIQARIDFTCVDIAVAPVFGSGIIEGYTTGGAWTISTSNSANSFTRITTSSSGQTLNVIMNGSGSVTTKCSVSTHSLTNCLDGSGTNQGCGTYTRVTTVP